MRWLLFALSLVQLGCVAAPFEAEGKVCADEDPCPASYRCAQVRVGARTCQKLAPGTPSFQVGRFTRGASPQRVPHTLGLTPSALLVWTSGPEAASASVSFGLSDGLTQRALALSDGVNAGRTRSARDLAPALVTVLSVDGTTRWTAELTDWDAQSFTLQWTGAELQPFELAFLAIGGPGVQSQLTQWEAPEKPGPVNVTTGFSPELVLHLGVPGTGIGIGAEGSLSAMNAAGGQWALSRSRLGDQTAGMFCGRAMDDTAAFVGLRSAMGVYRQGSRAVFAGMTADGFSLRFDSADVRGPVASLALAGVASALGRVTKPATPASTSEVTGLGFTPTALLVASSQLPPGTDLNWDVLWSLGAADATERFAIANRAQVGQLSVTQAASADTWLHLNRNGFVTARAQSELADHGFTLRYSPNDDAQLQLFYLALGAPP